MEETYGQYGLGDASAPRAGSELCRTMRLFDGPKPVGNGVRKSTLVSIGSENSGGYFLQSLVGSRGRGRGRLVNAARTSEEESDALQDDSEELWPTAIAGRGRCISSGGPWWGGRGLLWVDDMSAT